MSGFKVGNIKFGAGAIAAIIAVVVVAVIGAWVWSINNGVTNDGNVKEAALSTAYSSNQSTLSTCLGQIEMSAGVADEQSDRFIEAMKVAIEGRYADRAPNSSAMFSMIVEQYPDLASLSGAFDRVHNTMVGCTSNFDMKQQALQDRLRDYDAWRTGSWTVRFFGEDEFPSDNLYAQVGNEVQGTGMAALVKMRAVVQTKESADAFVSGEVEFDNPFGKAKPGN